MVLKVVIAEDDVHMRRILKKSLENLEGVQVIKEVGDGLSLVKAVEELKPDVIFVDVEMPEMDGLTAAKEIVDINPKVFTIFVTGFSEYSVKAFDIYAFDYLLKPFKIERIAKTMERVKTLIKERNLAKAFIKESKKISNLQRIMVQTNKELLFLDMDHIIMVTRSDRKTYIYLKGNEVINTTENLRDIEERLDKKIFFRFHKGYIVNINMIVSAIPWGKATYQLNLADCKETALTTVESFKKLKDMFGVK